MVNVSSSIKLSILAVVAIINCSHVGVLCFATVGANSHVSRRPSAAHRTRTTTRLLLSSSSASLSNDDSDNDNDDDSLRGGDTTTDSVEGAPLWPCGDALDRRLTKIALPCIANFAINPLIGAVDLFWINRMGDALSVAGQAAANQVFSSAFWLASFLPSGVCVHKCVLLSCFTWSASSHTILYSFYSHGNVGFY